LRAFDAEKLQGPLSIRDTAPGERLPGRPAELAQGTLTIADERTPIAMLFGETADGYEVNRDTRRVAVAAIQVDGVPQIAVDEALWLACAAVDTAK
jgi:phenylalanyl-tRNA synthetase beta subunit